MTETPEQIAARYGARVAPGVVVQQIARGVSSRPLPVWDGAKNCLVVPDWKEERQRAQKAAMRGAGRSGGRRRDPAVVARQALVRAMHDRGLSLDAMMAESGLDKKTLRNDLLAQGLKAARDPAAVAAALGRRRAVRLEQVRGLMARGLGRDEIAAALGIKEVRHVAAYMAEIDPTAKGARKPGRKPLDLPEVVARIVPLLEAGLGYGEIGARLGKSRASISGYVFRARAAGLLASADAPADAPADAERRAA